MASGFASVHPLTEQTLRELGVTDDQVTQGRGSAAASAGFHEPVGHFGGRAYGTCVDLTHSLCTPDFLQHCWAAGLVAFDRSSATGWTGSAHIHAVHIGLRDDHGTCRLLDGPRHQVVDFLQVPPFDGLAGHNHYLRGFLPSFVIQSVVRASYQAWVPDEATSVFYNNASRVRCYAWYDGQSVTAEVRAFFEWFRCLVTWDQHGVTVHKQDGTQLDLSHAALVFDGRWWRGSLRGMAEALGLACVFKPLGGTAAQVNLA